MLTCIIFVFLLVISAEASYMKDVPMKLKQPDGSILSCLATGNEFHNWLHDSNNYTIIKNPVSGYYVYAILVDGKVTPSSYVAGKIDPASVGITPGINLSDAEIAQTTAALKAKKAIPGSNLRTATTAEPVRPATGVYNNLVIFVSFSDQGEITLPMSTITSKFNAIGSASVRDFYKEVSSGQLDLSSSFYPLSLGTYPVSYHDSHPRSYYTKDAPDGYANGNPDATTREQTLLANAVTAVQNQVPANLLIDGDNDGNIDNIVFVINGYNEAWSDLLWPHRWSLFSQTATINGKRAYDYNIVFSEALGIGVICHELFHSFGAPDLYHYTDYPHEPCGDWDLMSSGDWDTPRHMTVYLKQHYANWVSSIPVLTTAGRYSLAPVSRSSFAGYRINLPNTTQYLVLEYRKKEGNYESSLSGDEGLLIYRINPGINGNGDDGPEELYIYRPGGTNDVNGNLDQATFSLNKNRTRFDDYSNPSCFLADGSLGGLAANLGITNVSVTGDIISFDYKGGSSNKAPAVSITTPAANTTFSAPAAITITAAASDSDGTISKVDFYNGSVLLGTDATAPYSFVWTSVAAGNYSLNAKATDNLGAVTTSLPVAVTVLAPPCTIAGTKVNTSVFLGTSGSWSGGTFDTKDRAYDGDITTYFDAPTGDPSWTGLDLISNKKITGIRFYPRAEFADRMIGGKFQGSSTVDFTSGVVDLYTVTASPAYAWNCVSISNTNSFRYVRYLAPANGYGNVNEIEFYGTSSTNVAPVVSITSPVNNTSFIAPASITINASASDADGSVAKVDFYNGATLLGTDATSPYSFIWNSVAPGTYTLTAKATDNNGAVTTSAIITVKVTPAANTAPTVSITAPVSNASYTAPASITINASASDADGSVAKVDFYNGAALLGTDATSPYSFIWNSVAPGTYVLTAKATDNSGSVTVSSAITVVVNAVVSNEDIIGSDCGKNSASGSYSLNVSDRANATNYNWWYTGSTQSITAVANQPYNATMTYGNSFSSGQLCVGVNYSISPWYKQYCKNISICPVNIGTPQSLSAVEEAKTIASPNPSSDNFKLTLKKLATLITITDSKGVVTDQYAACEESMEFGQELSEGMYTAFIHYYDNTTESIRLLKVK